MSATAHPLWDLPTRLCHWMIVVCIALSWWSAEEQRYQLHEWSGCTLIVLVLGRVIWGFIGSRHSRFSDFLVGPAKVLAYLRGQGSDSAGHNPLGGWSVLAMLLAVMLQACLGLFATDDIFTQGPLFSWVSKVTSYRLTRLHRLNQYVIMGLTAVHLFAILFHLFVKGENLIKPMLTGVKSWTGVHRAPSMAPAWLAALVAVLSAGAVYLIVY